MTETKYKINPVRATLTKFKDINDNIVGANDTCFGVCSAFSGTTDVYNMDPECTKSCREFIQQRKNQHYGFDTLCWPQVPYRPVIWERYTRYVPKLLKRGYSPEEALEEGKKLCIQHSPMLASECIDDCILDYNAIDKETVEGYKPDNNNNNNLNNLNNPNILNNPNNPIKLNNQLTKYNFSLESTEKEKSYFFLGFMIVIAILSVILIGMIFKKT